MKKSKKIKKEGNISYTYFEQPKLSLVQENSVNYGNWNYSEKISELEKKGKESEDEPLISIQHETLNCSF